MKDPFTPCLPPLQVRGSNKDIRSAVQDDKWLATEFITTVQQRGAAIIKVGRGWGGREGVIIIEVGRWGGGLGKGDHHQGGGRVRRRRSHQGGME